MVSPKVGFARWIEILYIQLYTYIITFEWDEAKNLHNMRKHGLSFEIASRVFRDPLAAIIPDPGTHGEERWQINGKIAEQLVILVVFVVHDESAEKTRIISARKVTAYERKIYEKR